MRVLSLEEFEEAIDKLDLYEKDYDILLKLLATNDSAFVTKVLEEIILGNLYFSDFEELLSNTEYPDLLKEFTNNQQKLEDKIRKMVALRERLNLKNLDIPTIAILPKDGKIYDDEKKRIYDELFFEVCKTVPGDGILAKAVKARIYNAIRNTDAYNLQYEASSPIPMEIVNMKKYEFLNYNDLLFSIADGAIGLNDSNQVLTPMDKEFMNKNNILEDVMKKIKSLALLFRKKNYNNTTDNTTEE